MHIRVERFLSDVDSTASEVFVDGERVCFGLEDERRDVKVAGETRIPAGVYSVGLRTVGGFHARYAKRFSAFHQGMLHVQGVPGFEFILIHCGNTDADTAGCLLVGDDVVTTHGAMRLLASVSAYTRLYRMVVGAAFEGDLTIAFVDLDTGAAAA